MGFVLSVLTDIHNVSRMCAETMLILGACLERHHTLGLAACYVYLAAVSRCSMVYIVVGSLDYVQ
jgi:hypothetical protein